MDHNAGKRPVLKRKLEECRNTYVDLVGERLHLKDSEAADILYRKYTCIYLEHLNMRLMQKEHGRTVLEYEFSNFISIIN